MGMPCLLVPQAVHWPIWAEETLLVLIALGALLTVVRELWSFLQPYRKVKHGIERLQYHFRTKNVVHIFGLYHELPSIEVIGRFALDDKEKDIQKGLPVPEENDSHAILAVEPNWMEDKLHFKVKGLEYHELKALRKAQEVEPRPGFGPARTVQVLSVNAVILCRQRKELILHTRAPTSATYPGVLYHTLGGGYMPPGIGAKDDLDSLKNTLTREVDEEARIKFSLEKIPPLLIMEEVLTGFIQVAFLGININAEQARELPENPRPVEGRPVRVRFDGLEEEILSRPGWVPTGKAAVLAWLALGAPGAGPYAKFGKHTAAELYERIMQKAYVEDTVLVSQLAGR